MPLVLIWSASTWSMATRREPATSRTPRGASAAQACERDIVGDRLVGDQAVATVLRHQAHAEGDRRFGTAHRDGLAVDPDLARAVALPGAVDRERGLDASGAEQAEQPDGLAGMQR